MAIEKDSMQPKIETLRKYYPASKYFLSDEELLETVEWVRVFSNKAHISPDNKILAGIIGISEARKKVQGSDKS